MRHCLAAAWALVSVVLAGCLPDRVSVDLRPPPAGLAETQVMTDDGASPSAPKVALIDVRGLILDAPSPGLLGTGPNPVDEFVARLQRAADDAQVRAVVVRINSPGGTVSGSDTMYEELRRFSARTGKPVVAAMGEVAASGGYYLALGADEIIAQPTTITASVGVIMQTINVSGGLAKLGIVARAVRSGPNKDVANPLEPMKDGHYALLQSMVDEFYGRFRGLVRERRPGISEADFDAMTDGRVVTGAEAARVGMVDGVGGLRDAFEAARRRAGVPAARLMKYHERGDAPRSAYAAAGQPAAGAEGVTVNLVQLHLSAGMLHNGAPAGFFYLWSPPTP